MDKNVSIHISRREQMNLMLNVYNCGNKDIRKASKQLADAYGLYYVHEGKGTIYTNEITASIKTGSIFALFPNKETIIKPDSGSTLNISWVTFSGYRVAEYLERGGFSAKNHVVQDSDEHEMETIITRLVTASCTMPNRYCKVMSSLYSAFAFLLDSYKRQKNTSHFEGYLYKALDYIEYHYPENITIEALADHVGVTRKYLYNIFKELTGMSPKNYLTYFKIDAACGLLENSNSTIEDIAVLVGYSNQFYFSKEFKKIVEKSPSEYRAWHTEDTSNVYRSPLKVLSASMENIPEELL